MKRLVLYLILALLLPISSALAVNPVTPPKSAVSKKQKRQQKKAAKWEKRMKKWQEKAAKKKKTTGSSLWDDDTFRLGALVALGGLAIRLFAFLPFLGGIFSFIGTLILLVGLGIMIWVLIDR